MAVNANLCQTTFAEFASPVASAHLVKLRTALDKLNTAKGNVQNCNCSPSNCCQSSTCQSCQTCQTSVCQSCQGCQTCQSCQSTTKCIATYQEF
jgi:hypothetical protein